jgi:hypothetical protein
MISLAIWPVLIHCILVPDTNANYQPSSWGAVHGPVKCCLDHIQDRRAADFVERGIERHCWCWSVYLESPIHQTSIPTRRVLADRRGQSYPLLQDLRTRCISVHMRSSRISLAGIKMIITTRCRQVRLDRFPFVVTKFAKQVAALSGACATISSDALMNPFDGASLYL